MSVKIDQEDLKVVLKRIIDLVDDTALALMSADITESLSHDMNNLSSMADDIQKDVDEL